MPCSVASPPPSLLLVLGHREESLCGTGVPGNELDEIQCVAVLH